jgi:hypothetical protein
MIDEALLKSNFLGRDGFIWWVGQVADPKHWRNEKTRIDEGKEAWGYRCKVRIIGYHSFDRNELKDEDLPWAHILTSASDGAPAQGGFGKLPLLVGGESVVGFFLDGEEAQQPVVMGCFHRSPVVENVDNPNPFEPFTGSKGEFSKGGSRQQATREKAQNDGTAKEVDENIGPGSQFEMFSNPKFGTDSTGSLDLDPGFSPLSSDTSSNAGASFGSPNIPQDQLFYGDRAEIAFLNEARKLGPVQGENGCGNNILSQITAALQTFIQTINGFEKTALGFIDPIRNVVVDIQQIVRSVARLVASIMKFVINGMRDSIFKLIGKLFKLLGITIPSPLQLPISEAAKNILNIIFCLFEKLFGPLLDFLMGLLNGLVGKSPNIPRCAVEEITGSLVNKLADMIDGALSTILSGLDWLANGISSIASALTSGLNMISQILSFLSCDSLACKSTTSWDPFAGASFPSLDSWKSVLSNMDILNGLGTPDFSLGYLSAFGSSDTPFKNCRKKIVNPQTQEDLAPMPIGVKFYKCIPPEVTIYGDGTGARAKAVVSETDGSVVTFLLCDPGKGYTYPPEIKIVDNSNHGRGAQARTKVVDGKIQSIYIINPGQGYCQTNLTEETSPTSTTGIGSTSTQSPCLDVGDRRLSNAVVGINTNLVIERPGLGYTSGDTIQVGNCLYQPILTNNGSIIDFKSNGTCKQTFKTTPGVSINTKTGEGAVIYPVLQFVPQFIVDNPDLNVGIGSVVNVVDCV